MTALKSFIGTENINFFKQDSRFQILLAALLPPDLKPELFASLDECGALVSGRWNDLANAANRRENEPRIVKFDRRGNAVEQIDFGLPVSQLRREVAEFGVLTRSK